MKGLFICSPSFFFCARMVTSSPLGRSSRNSTASSRMMFAKSTLLTYEQESARLQISAVLQPNNTLFIYSGIKRAGEREIANLLFLINGLCLKSQCLGKGVDLNIQSALANSQRNVWRRKTLIWECHWNLRSVCLSSADENFQTHACSQIVLTCSGTSVGETKQSMFH